MGRAITRIDAGQVEFDYGGLHQKLLTMIGPADVQWAARQLSRLTDAQWHDAFRAGNYARHQAERYLRRIKEKIANGLTQKVESGK